jgi:hypothetical protein
MYSLTDNLQRGKERASLEEAKASTSSSDNMTSSIAQCTAWINKQMTDREEIQKAHWEKIIDIHRSIIAVCVASDQSDFDPIKGVKVAPIYIPVMRATRILHHAASVLTQQIIIASGGKTMAKKSLHVTFAFDEARAFLASIHGSSETGTDTQSFLHYLRQAMHLFPRKTLLEAWQNTRHDKFAIRHSV